MGVIGEVVSVAALLQAEVAIAALPFKALLGTLHPRHHHRRHHLLPLVAMASRQMEKGIEDPVPQTLTQAPGQIPRPPMPLNLPLRLPQKTFRLLPLITRAHPRTMLRPHHNPHPN